MWACKDLSLQTQWPHFFWTTLFVHLHLLTANLINDVRDDRRGLHVVHA